MSTIQQLITNLYANQSPFDSVDVEKYADDGYPHTNLIPHLCECLFKDMPPTYIVECGSMLGGSVLRMMSVLKSMGIADNTGIVCIDPFTGDVNMWDWEYGHIQSGEWRFLRLENGIPTIYKRFLANIKAAGHSENVLPINCTTTVGLKLLQRLQQQGRITAMPNYLYLDSAHEPDETFIELSLAWQTLTSDGVLFGDDWCWDAVRNDVVKFAHHVSKDINRERLARLHQMLPGSQIYNDTILLYEGQWVLFK